MLHIKHYLLIFALVGCTPVAQSGRTKPKELGSSDATGSGLFQPKSFAATKVEQDDGKISLNFFFYSENMDLDHMFDNPECDVDLKKAKEFAEKSTTVTIMLEAEAIDQASSKPSKMTYSENDGMDVPAGASYSRIKVNDKSTTPINMSGTFSFEKIATEAGDTFEIKVKSKADKVSIDGAFTPKLYIPKKCDVSSSKKSSGPGTEEGSFKGSCQPKGDGSGFTRCSELYTDQTAPLMDVQKLECASHSGEEMAPLTQDKCPSAGKIAKCTYQHFIVNVIKIHTYLYGTVNESQKAICEAASGTYTQY